MRARLGEWRTLIARVRANYERAHGRPLRLLRPRAFTEKMQWRKLFDANPDFVVFNDKVAVRAWAERVLGRQMTVPLLWVGDDPAAVPLDTLPRPCVVKPSHLSGNRFILSDGAAVDDAARRAEMASWLARCHGTALVEPGYLGIPRRILVEPMLLEDEGEFVPEYKVYCFAGQPVIVKLRQVYDALGIQKTRTFFDTDWNLLPIRVGAVAPLREPPPPPPQLPTLLAVAAALSRGYDHLRIDFYVHRGVPLLSEITPYDTSGLLPYDPPQADMDLGRSWPLRWSAARAAWAVVSREWSSGR